MHSSCAESPNRRRCPDDRREAQFIGRVIVAIGSRLYRLDAERFATVGDTGGIDFQAGIARQKWC
jgi:hypothetical protein